MKKNSPRIIAALVASLFAVSPALADDDPFTLKGEVGLGVRFVDTKGGTRDGAFANSLTPTATPFQGPEDKAKFNEFRDLRRDTAIGIVDVSGGSSRNYLNFYGENFGLADQFLDLQGGRYGDFKYQLYNDNMPHNYSWGALTPMNGAGTSVQTANPPLGWNPNNPADPHNNPNSWKPADVGWKRNTYGGNFEYSGNTPWYGRAEAQEYTTKGTRQISYPFTNSSGAGWMDLVAPVDYRTQNLVLEGGYKVKQGFISLNVTRSNFNNSQETLSFQDPKFGNGMMNVNLPPDNSMTKYSLNGALRQLPLSSTLSGRWSYNELKNSFSVQTTALTGGAIGGTVPTFTTQSVSSSNFNGKKTTNTGALSLVSNPLQGFDTKLFANWYDRNNKSTQISYAGAAPGDLFQYSNRYWGFDLGYRFNPENKLQGGYEDKHVTRTSTNAAPFLPAKTQDQKVWAEFANTSLDALTGRLKFERVDRRSDQYDPAATTPPTLVTNPSRYQIMDTANFDQNRYRLILDSNPMPLLDIGLQAIYKTTDYKNVYGILSDKRNEWTANLSYGDARVFRVSLFADWENVKAKDKAFEGTLGAPPSGTNFDVVTTQKTTNKMFGIAADWPATDKLVLNVSYIWSKTGGGVDFSHNATSTPAPTFFNGGLPPFVTDNTTKQSLVFKGKYDIDKKFGVTGGYAYERYKYDDDQMNGYFGLYPYYMVASATNTSIMNGVWTNPSYKANVLWMMGTYKFD